MSRAALIMVLAGLWAGLFAWSFVHFQITAPSDMGFTRGLNRVAGFLGWQGLALIAALGAVIAGFGLPKQARAMRWLSRAPVLGELILCVALAAIVVATMKAQQQPQDLPPAREPVEPTFG